MVCAPVTDARVPRCVCRQVVIGAVDAPPKSKKRTMPAFFLSGAASPAPPVPSAPQKQKNGTVLAAPGSPPAVAVLSPMYLSKYLSNVTSARVYILVMITNFTLQHA